MNLLSYFSLWVALVNPSLILHTKIKIAVGFKFGIQKLLERATEFGILLVWHSSQLCKYWKGGWVVTECVIDCQQHYSRKILYAFQQQCPLKISIHMLKFNC